MFTLYRVVQKLSC